MGGDIKYRFFILVQYMLGMPYFLRSQYFTLNKAKYRIKCNKTRDVLRPCQSPKVDRNWNMYWPFRVSCWKIAKHILKLTLLCLKWEMVNSWKELLFSSKYPLGKSKFPASHWFGGFNLLGNSLLTILAQCLISIPSENVRKPLV